MTMQATAARTCCILILPVSQKHASASSLSCNGGCEKATKQSHFDSNWKGFFFYSGLLHYTLALMDFQEAAQMTRLLGQRILKREIHWRERTRQLKMDDKFKEMKVGF